MSDVMSIQKDDLIFKMIVENSLDGIILADADTRKFIMCNQSMREMLGYGEEEILHLRIDDIHPEKDLADLLDQFELQILGKERIAEDCPVKRKNGSILYADISITHITIKNKTWVLGFFRDVTDRLRIEKSIQYCMDFQRMITTLSTKMINLSPNRIDEGINQALQELGMFTHVDRSCVFLFHDDGNQMDNTHEWCAEGIESHIGRLKNLPVEVFSWAISKIVLFETIHIPRISDLPVQAQAEKAEFEKEGIKSVILVPMICTRQVVGFLGCVSVKEEKTWSEDAIQLLRLVGEILANAITRQKADILLRENAFNILKAQRVASLGSWVWNLQTNQINISDEMASIWGYNREEKVKSFKNMMGRIHPEDLRRVEKAINRTIKKGMSYNAEFRIVLPSGEIRYIHGMADLEKDEKGQLLLLRGTSQDITERKKIDQTLQESQERLKLALEATNDGIFDWNMQTGEAYFSPRYYTMLDYEPNELPPSQNTWANLIHPEDKTYVDDLIQGYFEGKRDYHEVEYRLKTKSGEWRWILSMGKVTERDDDGNPVRMVGIHSDISDRKQVEKALQIQRELGIVLSSVTDLTEAIHQVLEAVLQMKEFDSGSIYIVDEKTGSLDLIAHKGLGESFINDEAHYDAGKPNAQLALSGDPIYKYASDFPPELGEPLHKEGLCVMAIVPVVHEERVVAVMNLSSHSFNTVPMHARNALEAIAAQVGGVILRLKAEEESQLNEERLSRFMNSASDSFCLLDSGLHFVEINQKGLEIIGKSRKEIIGKHITEVVPDAEKSGRLKKHLEVLRTGKPFVIENFVPHPVFGDMYFILKSFKVGDGLGVIIADITERKKAEEALLSSEEKFRSLAEQSPNMIFINKKGRIVYANQKCIEVMGYSREEFYADDFDFLKLTDPGHYDLVKEKFHQHMAGKDVEPYEYAVVTKNGKRLTTILTSKLIDYEGTKAILGTITDITDRKLAEEELQREKEFTDTALNAQLDTFFVFDPATGKALRWNKTFNEISGYSDEEIFKMKAPDSYYSKSDLEKARDYTQLVLKGSKGTVVLELITKDGKRIPTEYSASAIFDEKGDPKYLIAVGRDISERRKAERTLRENEQLLREIAANYPHSYVSIINKDLTVGFTSGQEFSIQGLNPEDYVGMTMDEVFQKHAPMVKKQYRKTFRGEQASFEIFFNNQHQFIQTVPLTNEGGKIDRILAVVENITERKNAENALKESEARLKSTIESLPFDFFALDADGRYVLQNTICREHGGDAIGKRPEDIAPDGDIKSIWIENNQRALSGEVVEGDVAYEYHGEKGYYHNIISPVYIDQEIRGVVGVNIDITERKRAEEQVVGLNQLQADLFTYRSLDEKIKMITDGVVKIFNADFARIWLIKPGDLCDSGCTHTTIMEGPHICRNRNLCLHLMASSGRYTRIDGEMHQRVPFDCYKIGQIASGKKPKFITNDILNDKRIHNRTWAKELGLISFAGYQLLSAIGKPIGVLALFSRHAISPDEDARLEVVANTTAQIIQTTQAEERIQKDLKEKEVLLQEIHHRVKNNLSVISSLLNLQANKIESKEKALEAFRECKDRVYAMSLVHEKLYKSENFAKIDMKSYVETMVRELGLVYGIRGKVNLDINVKDVFLDINTAIPTGLILNELITNAFKHAFPKESEGNIFISLLLKQKMHELIVKDDGIGLSPHVNIQTSDSLGLQLICILTEQIEGTLKVDRKDGTRFKILFPIK